MDGVTGHNDAVLLGSDSYADRFDACDVIGGDPCSKCALAALSSEEVISDAPLWGGQWGGSSGLWSLVSGVFFAGPFASISLRICSRFASRLFGLLLGPFVFKSWVFDATVAVALPANLDPLPRELEDPRWNTDDVGEFVKIAR